MEDEEVLNGGAEASPWRRSSVEKVFVIITPQRTNRRVIPE